MRFSHVLVGLCALAVGIVGALGFSIAADRLTTEEASLHQQLDEARSETAAARKQAADEKFLAGELRRSLDNVERKLNAATDESQELAQDLSMAKDSKQVAKARAALLEGEVEAAKEVGSHLREAMPSLGIAEREFLRRQGERVTPTTVGNLTFWNSSGFASFQPISVDGTLVAVHCALQGKTPERRARHARLIASSLKCHPDLCDWLPGAIDVAAEGMDVTKDDRHIRCIVWMSGETVLLTFLPGMEHLGRTVDSMRFIADELHAVGRP